MFVTPQPTIEFEYDGGKGKKSLHVPKLRVTFYVYGDYTKAFAEKFSRRACLRGSDLEPPPRRAKARRRYVDYRAQIKFVGAFVRGRRGVCSMACWCSFSRRST